MKLAITLSAALALAGCATPYKSDGILGGYSEQQLAEDVFRVTFGGNGYTSTQRAQDFAMLRAAELTLQHGYKYFAVLNERADRTAQALTLPGYGQTTGTVNAYGNYTTYVPGQTFVLYRPNAGLMVRGFREKPEAVFTFDAEFLQTSLKRSYHIK